MIMPDNSNPEIFLIPQSKRFACLPLKYLFAPISKWFYLFLCCRRKHGHFSGQDESGSTRAAGGMNHFTIQLAI